MTNHVEFGSDKRMGFLGVTAGTAIAIGVPWVVLGKAGAAGLGGVAATVICIIGVAGGVALAIVAAFFSLVMPSKVGKE